MKFSMKLTPKIESMLWGACGGAAALAIVGFMFGGWVTGGKAKEMAQQQSDKASSPCCRRSASTSSVTPKRRRKFGQAQCHQLLVEKGTYVSAGGWATMPGNAEPNSAVAQAAPRC